VKFLILTTANAPHGGRISPSSSASEIIWRNRKNRDLDQKNCGNVSKDAWKKLKTMCNTWTKAVLNVKGTKHPLIW